MAKTDVTQWDTTASNNSDINGINIAEGCAAAGINDSIRTIMAQIAAWITGALFRTPNAGTTGGVRIAGNATSGSAILQFVDSAASSQWAYISVTSAGNLSFTDSQGNLRPIGYRNLPPTAGTTGRSLALTDVGVLIPATGAMTVPPNSSVAFAIGDTVTIYNNSASTITITQGTGVTLRLIGSATTGNRSLAQRGICTVVKVGTDEWVATGGGVS
jgi:hypothetical protein